jgi:hypothetical protein
VEQVILSYIYLDFLNLLLFSSPDSHQMVIASSLPSGHILLNNEATRKNEFVSAVNGHQQDYLYVPHILPGVAGLYDRVMYFSVSAGAENERIGNQICFIEPAMEGCDEDSRSGCGSSTQESSSGYFRSKMRRTYTPIYLEASSSNFDESVAFRRQGSHVPS